MQLHGHIVLSRIHFHVYLYQVSPYSPVFGSYQSVYINIIYQMKKLIEKG